MEALQQVIAKKALQLGEIPVGVGRQDHLEGEAGAVQKRLFGETAVRLAQRVQPVPLDKIDATPRINGNDVGRTLVEPVVT